METEKEKKGFYCLSSVAITSVDSFPTSTQKTAPETEVPISAWAPSLLPESANTCTHTGQASEHEKRDISYLRNSFYPLYFSLGSGSPILAGAVASHERTQ